MVHLHFSSQELLIQQLQDELNFYRDGDNSTSDVPPVAGGATLDNKRLQNKLRAAVKQIRQLAQEKQQLIQVGNRQRAELLNAGKYGDGRGDGKIVGDGQEFSSCHFYAGHK